MKTKLHRTLGRTIVLPLILAITGPTLGHAQQEGRAADPAIMPSRSGQTGVAINRAAERIGEGVLIDRRTGEVRFSGRAHCSYVRAYACPHFDAAQSVIAAIPASGETAAFVARQVAAMRSALRRHGCSPARGTFYLTDAGAEVTINHGYEAEEVWIAASARNIHHRELGLIIDASPYGPTQ